MDHQYLVLTLTLTSIRRINLHSAQSKKQIKSDEHIASKLPPKMRSTENVGRMLFFSCDTIEIKITHLSNVLARRSTKTKKNTDACPENYKIQTWKFFPKNFILDVLSLTAYSPSDDHTISKADPYDLFLQANAVYIMYSPSPQTTTNLPFGLCFKLWKHQKIIYKQYLMTILLC